MGYWTTTWNMYTTFEWIDFWVYDTTSYTTQTSYIYWVTDFTWYLTYTWDITIAFSWQYFINQVTEYFWTTTWNMYTTFEWIDFWVYDTTSYTTQTSYIY